MKNNIKIPKLSELIKYETLDSKLIINEINWGKFIELQNISSGSSFETGKKIERFIGYYICYLVQKDILENIQKNRSSYIILAEMPEKSTSNMSLNLERDGTIYGFIRKKDAMEYSRIAHAEIDADFIIEKYEDLYQQED